MQLASGIHDKPPLNDIGTYIHKFAPLYYAGVRRRRRPTLAPPPCVARACNRASAPPVSAAEEMVFAMLMAYKQASGIKYIARLNDIGKYAAVGSTNSSVSAAVVRAYDRRKVVASGICYILSEYKFAIVCPSREILPPPACAGSSCTRPCKRLANGAQGSIRY